MLTNNFNNGSYLLFTEFSFYIESSIGLWEEMRQNRSVCPKLGRCPELVYFTVPIN